MTDARMFQRRGTAAAWTLEDPVLAEGEVGFETDTQLFKIGTGSTIWSLLRYQGVPEDPISISAYAATAGANFTATPTTMALTTARPGAAGLFVLAGNAITVNRTGRFRFVADVTIENVAGGGNNGAAIWLERNGVEEAGTRAAPGCVRSGTPGAGSISAMLDVVSGDVFRLRAVRTSGGSILRSQANGVRLMIEEERG